MGIESQRGAIDLSGNGIGQVTINQGIGIERSIVTEVDDELLVDIERAGRGELSTHSAPQSGKIQDAHHLGLLVLHHTDVFGDRLIAIGIAEGGVGTKQIGAAAHGIIHVLILQLCTPAAREDETVVVDLAHIVAVGVVKIDEVGRRIALLAIIIDPDELTWNGDGLCLQVNGGLQGLCVGIPPTVDNDAVLHVGILYNVQYRRCLTIIVVVIIVHLYVFAQQRIKR